MGRWSAPGKFLGNIVTVGDTELMTSILGRKPAPMAKTPGYGAFSKACLAGAWPLPA